MGTSIKGIPFASAYSQSPPLFDELLNARSVEPFSKVKLSVTIALPSARVLGAKLNHATMIFLMVPETAELFTLPPARAELKKDAGGGLNETTVESYSILRVREPMFVKLVTVTGTVKVVPGQTEYVPIVVIGALVANMPGIILKKPEIKKRIGYNLYFIIQSKETELTTKISCIANISIKEKEINPNHLKWSNLLIVQSFKHLRKKALDLKAG